MKPAPREALACLGIGLLLAAWSWALSQRMAGPIIFHDELAPISFARHLRSDVPVAQIGVPFYPAYGALVAAFVPPEADPLAAHRAARAVNALLLGVAGVAACALARVLMPDASRGARLAVALAACMHAPIVLYGHLAMADNALIAGIVVASAAMARAFQSPTPVRVVTAGLVAGALPLIHVRAVPVVVAAGASWVAYVVFTKRNIAVAGRFLAPLVLGAILSWLGAGYAARVAPPAFERLARSHTVNRFAIVVRSSRVKRLPAIVAGQVGYLSGSSLGVALCGLVGGALLVVRRRGGAASEPARATALFVSLAALGTGAIAMVFVNSLGMRPDALFGGRYEEAMVVPLLVLGFATLATASRGSRRARLRWMLGVGIATAGLGAVIPIAARLLRLERAFNPVNAMGIYPWLGALEHPALVRVAAVGAVLATLGVGAALVRPALGRALFVAFAMASALWTSSHYLVRGSLDRAGERTVVAAIGRIRESRAAPECIALDYSEPTAFNTHVCQLHHPLQRFRFFDGASGAKPCSDLVVSGRPGFAEENPGARVVVRERADRVRLWSLPGARQQALADRGFLEPARWGALPGEAMRSRLRWIDVPAASAGEGDGRRMARLEVEHAGGASPWPSLAELGRPELAVRIGVRWYRDEDRTKPVVESRAELPLELLPGARAEVALALPPDQPVIPPGRYHLAIGLLQEGVRWFHDAGDAILETDVTVGG